VRPSRYLIMCHIGAKADALRGKLANRVIGGKAAGPL
jgi:hypothetical protein